MERWKRLPDSELEVMLIIWDGKEKVSTSDIMQHLKEKKSVQLVQNALNRLEGKGFVQCEKLGVSIITHHLCRWTNIGKKKPLPFWKRCTRIREASCLPL